MISQNYGLVFNNAKQIPEKPDKKKNNCSLVPLWQKFTCASYFSRSVQFLFAFVLKPDGLLLLSVKQESKHPDNSKSGQEKRCSPAFGPRARRFFGPPHMVSAKLYKHDFLFQLPGGLFYL
jgi:hypothetical protein